MRGVPKRGDASIGMGGGGEGEHALPSGGRDPPFKNESSQKNRVRRENHNG